MKLDDAVRALREESVLAPERRRALRERVAQRPPRAKKIAWVLPLAAALAAGTVYAGIHGGWIGRKDPTPVVSPVETSAPVVETTVAPPVVSAPPPVASTMIALPAPMPMPTPSVAAEDRSLRAYREAERIQRVEKDCARAVPAWDAYLAQAGSSPLAVDARFSRAICLVRLGRADDARSALAPFARGESGSYRQSEAQSLLDELNGEAGTGH